MNTMQERIPRGDHHEALLYRLLVKNLKDYAIFQVDLEGRMASWNAGVERNLGYAEQEFIGMRFSQIFTDIDVVAGVPEQELQKARETGCSEDERWHQRKDGSKFFVYGMVTALYDQGELTGFSKVMRDQTDRQLAQEAMQRSNEELSDFAAVVAHDLRTPLRTIRAHTQLLATTLQGRLDAADQELMAHIQHGAKSMSQLIESLWEYARVGEEPEIRGRNDLGTLVESVWGALQSLVDETGATLQIETRPIVTGNPMQLKRIFQNLLENALKYRGTRTPHIVVRAEDQPWDWRISVQDNGPGIDAQKAAHIFDPLLGQPGRVGMGLAICKKLVSRMGGQIRVESSSGKGTTFSFTIPRP